MTSGHWVLIRSNNRFCPRSGPRVYEVQNGQITLSYQGVGRARVPLDQGRGAVLMPLEMVRRGIARFERLWVRWTGPLGLAWNQGMVEVGSAFPVLPDLRPVQIVEPDLQRPGLDRIGPKFVRRLHVTARFDDNLSGFGFPQVGLGHLGHEAGGAADHDDTREAQQLLRVGELLLGGEQLRV